MKKILLLVLLLPIATFAFPAFQGLAFDSDASALAWVETLESRWSHQPEWTYCDHASPTIHLTDGRKVVVVVDSARQYMTAEELAGVVEIDSSLVPPSPEPPAE